MSEFGDRLREERKRLKLNQTLFGQFGNVGLNTQSDYEAGLRSPTSDYLSGIAAIGVDVQYILTSVRSGSAMPMGGSIPGYPEITPRMLIETLQQIESTIMERGLAIRDGKLSKILLIVCKEMIEKQRASPKQTFDISSLSSFHDILDLASTGINSQIEGIPGAQC